MNNKSLTLDIVLPLGYLATLLSFALQLFYKVIITSNCQGGHHDHKLIKIHFIVLIGIQVLHYLINQMRVLLALEGKRKSLIPRL